MKKPFSFFVTAFLFVFLLGFSGCASVEVKEEPLVVPYSEGPPAPPSMNGPTAPLPDESVN